MNILNNLSPKPKIKSKPRAILAIVIFFTILLSLALVLLITDQLISLMERFQQLPLSTALLFSGAVFLFTLIIGWVIYRLIFPKSHHSTAQKNEITSEKISKESIQNRINEVREEGVISSVAEDNLALLDQRSSKSALKQTIYIAMFGEINMGKTAIVSALLPHEFSETESHPETAESQSTKANLTSHAIGGSTKSVHQYQWKIDQTDIIVSDLPGTGQVEDNTNTHSIESSSLLTAQETIQAHLVLYICDGDINKQQYDELLQILALKKPTIIVINKTDQYTLDEQEKIHQHLQKRFSNKTNISPPEAIVFVNSGGFKSLIQIDKDGNETTIERPIPADVSALKKAIQTVLANKSGSLSELRDQSVLSTISQQLDIAEQKLKLNQAQEVAQQYTRKAVVGALAAVSPGTDVIIQAYLGTSMVREISGIYNIKVSNFDVNTLLKLIQNQVGRMLPLILTITGNALKAFPGIGTLAGGIIHAVAYGMVFNTLGKSLIKTLSQQSDLKPAETAKVFQEMLSGNMEKDSTNIIKLVLNEQKKAKERK